METLDIRGSTRKGVSARPNMGPAVIQGRDGVIIIPTCYRIEWEKPERNIIPLTVIPSPFGVAANVLGISF